MGIEKLCMWRTVVEKDFAKLAVGNDCVTFDAKNKCYHCEGYNTGCSEYTPVSETADYKPKEYEAQQ